MTRRTVLALATGSLVLGGLAAPALAAPVGTDSEYVCVYTRNDHKTGERDGFCVWFPDYVPHVPIP
jgi:hypothetical protein